MKLFALASIVMLTAATGAFAQAAAPMANENPDNCSAAWRDCSTSQDGSNHLLRRFTEPRQTGFPNQPSQTPSENPADAIHN
jgi:hypothetical protein